MADEVNDFNLTSENVGPDHVGIGAFSIPGHQFLFYFFTEPDVHIDSMDDLTLHQQAQALADDILNRLKVRTEELGGGYDEELSEYHAGFSDDEHDDDHSE